MIKNAIDKENNFQNTSMKIVSANFAEYVTKNYTFSKSM